MKKLLYLLYQPYKFLIVLPLVAVATIFFGTLAIFLSTVISQRAGSVIGGTCWARFISFITPMLVSVSGLENINRKLSYVIVANHQSFYDIFVIYGWLRIDIRWVMKMELRKVPFLGAASEKVGHIFVERTDSKSSRAALEKVKERMKPGTSVIFFPEGTRSVSGELGEFKKGAFHFAFDLSLPILPVTIIGTEKILPPATMNLFPGRARMIIHPPVHACEYGKENMDKLISDVKETISSGRQRGKTT
ncbi:MAG: lysophospholipid acyltransferase family protein [bacterium]